MISETDKPRTYAQMIAELAGEDESLRHRLLCELGALVVVDPPLSYDEITQRMIVISDELKQSSEESDDATGATDTRGKMKTAQPTPAREPLNIRIRHLIYSRELLPNSDRNYIFGEGEGKQIEQANIMGFEKQGLILYVYLRDGELSEAQQIAEQLISEGLL